MKPGSLAPAGAATRRRIELAFLPAALEVIDTPASPTAHYTAAAVAAFFTAAVTWSILGHVDIIATAPGAVIPAGETKTVQPLEAGVVKSILVQDSDHVRAGQTLVELDVVAAAAARDRYARDLRRARLDVAGLQALREAFAGSEPLDRFAPPTGLPDRRDRDRAGRDCRPACRAAIWPSRCWRRGRRWGRMRPRSAGCRRCCRSPSRSAISAGRC